MKHIDPPNGLGVV